MRTTQLLVLVVLAACVTRAPQQALLERRIVLQHAPATALASRLNEVMSPTCSMRNADGNWVWEEIADCCVAEPDTNALVLRGTADDLRDVGGLVAQLDQSGASSSDQDLCMATYEVAFVERRIALRYANAERLVEELGTKLMGWSLSTDLHGRQLPCERFSWFDGKADPTTNTIAVRGARYLVLQMMSAILRRDVPR